MSLSQILRICLPWNMFLKTQDALFTVQTTFNASDHQQAYLLLTVPSTLHKGNVSLQIIQCLLELLFRTQEISEHAASYFRKYHCLPSYQLRKHKTFVGESFFFVDYEKYHRENFRVHLFPCVFLFTTGAIKKIKFNVFPQIPYSGALMSQLNQC